MVIGLWHTTLEAPHVVKNTIWRMMSDCLPTKKMDNQKNIANTTAL